LLASDPEAFGFRMKWALEHCGVVGVSTAKIVPTSAAYRVGAVDVTILVKLATETVRPPLVLPEVATTRDTELVHKFASVRDVKPRGNWNQRSQGRKWRDSRQLRSGIDVFDIGPTNFGRLSIS